MSRTILLLAGDVELSNCTADGQLLNRDTNSDDYVSITSGGNGEKYIALKDFDFSTIPSNAVITNAIARVKVAALNVDTVSGMGFMVRYNAQSYGSTNYSYYKTPRILTYGFLRNMEKVDPSVFYVRFNTTSLDTVKFYGADVLIEYDLPVNKVVYGTTVLVDLTADTVTPETLLQGYTAHDKSGALITGTADTTEGSVYQDGDGYLVVDDSESSAPQGNLSITANGTYDVADYAGATINVGGGGGLEYEEGTITVPYQTANYEIYFNDTHDRPPAYYTIVSLSNAIDTGQVMSCTYSLNEAYGATPANQNYNTIYGSVTLIRTATSGSTINTATYQLTYPQASSNTGTSYPKYWATESRIVLYASTTYAIGGNYKWIAVWAPAS